MLEVYWELKRRWKASNLLFVWPLGLFLTGMAGQPFPVFSIRYIM